LAKIADSGMGELIANKITEVFKLSCKAGKTRVEYKSKLKLRHSVKLNTD